jgi:hypothetical protein
MDITVSAWKAEVVAGMTTAGYAEWAAAKAHQMEAVSVRLISDDEVESAAKGNRDRIFDALAAAGVDSVAVEYSGYGDSGQIDMVDLADLTHDISIDYDDVLTHYQDGQKGLSLLTKSKRLGDAIEGFCWEILEAKHGGWENDAGGNGKFTFNVPERTITFEHNEAYTEYTKYTHEV